MKKSKVIFFLALLGINLCAKYFFELQLTFRQVLTIHIFLFLLFFLTDLIQTKFSNHKNSNPLVLLSINFLRILACIFFLLPTVLKHEKMDNSYIYNFFAIYFVILFSDIFLKHKNEKK